jgi:hypothetical protein
MSTVKEKVESWLHELVQKEVDTVLPKLGAMVPGVAGQLLAGLLSQPAVQAELVTLEDKGLDFLVDEVEKAYDKLEAYVEAHVHGVLGDFVHGIFHQDEPAVLSLSPVQVTQLKVLAAADRLNAVLEQGIAFLGLAQKA